MTASHGYWTYYDIIQGYELTDKRIMPNKEPSYYSFSIAGFLNTNPNFKYFMYLLKTAQTDKLANEQEYNTTLFICDDDTIRKMYGEEFIMNLDRNTARKLLNLHSLPKIIHKKTLLGRRVAVLDTKDFESELTITNNKGDITLMSGNTRRKIISEEIEMANGLIYVLDGLLIPENFTF